MAFALADPLKGLSKTEKIAAIGGAAAIGGYFVIRHHSTTGSWNPWSTATATSASGASNPDTLDPVTGLPVGDDNVIDPITNLPYLAEAQQYGSVATAEASVSAYGQSSGTGSGIGVNPAVPESDQGSANTVVGGSVYTSNSAWAQAVQAGLSDVGYNATDVSTALGLYLTGQPVSSTIPSPNTQVDIVNAAIAEYGQPPIGSLQVILQPVSMPSTTTTGTSTTVSSATTAKPGMPTGVKASAVTANGFTVNWNKVTGATDYDVRITYQSAAVWTGSTSGTSIKVTGLGANRTYTIHVAAKNSAGISPETNGPAQKTSA